MHRICFLLMSRSGVRSLCSALKLISVSAYLIGFITDHNFHVIFNLVAYISCSLLIRLGSLSALATCAILFKQYIYMQGLGVPCIDSCTIFCFGIDFDFHDLCQNGSTIASREVTTLIVGLTLSGGKEGILMKFLVPSHLSLPCSDSGCGMQRYVSRQMWEEEIKSRTETRQCSGEARQRWRNKMEGEGERERRVLFVAHHQRRARQMPGRQLLKTLNTEASTETTPGEVTNSSSSSSSVYSSICFPYFL